MKLLKKHIFQPKLRKFSDDIYNFAVSSLSSSSLRPWQATKPFLEIFHGTAGSPSLLGPSNRMEAQFAGDFMNISNGFRCCADFSSREVSS